MSGGQRESTSKAGCSRSAGRPSGQIVDSHENSKDGKKSRMLHLKLFGGEVVIEQLQEPGHARSVQTLTCAQAQAAQTSTGVAILSNACQSSPLPYVLFSSGRSSAVIPQPVGSPWLGPTYPKEQRAKTKVEKRAETLMVLVGDHHTSKCRRHSCEPETVTSTRAQARA